MATDASDECTFRRLAKGLVIGVGDESGCVGGEGALAMRPAHNGRPIKTTNKIASHLWVASNRIAVIGRAPAGVVLEAITEIDYGQRVQLRHVFDRLRVGAASVAIREQQATDFR